MSDKNFTPAQKIAKESTISFVGIGYGQFVRYLFTALLARLVGVQYLGIYSLGNSITNIAGVLSKAGTDVGLMRYISRRDTAYSRSLGKRARPEMRELLFGLRAEMLDCLIIQAWGNFLVFQRPKAGHQSLLLC